MNTDPLRPEILVSVSNEMEANILMDTLAGHEIRAKAVGGYTAGFLAEAPGKVDVIVGQADLALAQRILAETPRERAEIDWSSVDFGEGDFGDSQLQSTLDLDGPTGAVFDLDPESDQPGSQAGPHSYQFSITGLLVLQTIVSVALAILVGYSAALLGAIVAVAGTFVLIVAGTIQIGSNPKRARQAWTYLGRALIVVYVMLALIKLFPTLTL